MFESLRIARTLSHLILAALLAANLRASLPFPAFPPFFPIILAALFSASLLIYTTLRMKLHTCQFPSFRLSVPLALNTANIDWSGLKCAAIALNSVREAAMRAAADLPPIERNRFVERVNKRAYRERWLDLPPDSKPRTNGSLPLSKAVQNGSDTLALMLAERHGKSRLHLSRYVMDASEKSARSKGDHKLARSTREVATIMEKVWPNEKEQNANTLVSVQILNER